MSVSIGDRVMTPAGAGIVTHFVDPTEARGIPGLVVVRHADGRDGVYGIGYLEDL